MSYINKNYAMTDVTENPNNWKPSGEGDGSIKLDKVAGRIASTVKLVGVIVSVISLSIIGIKFMLGSVEEKAQYKQTLVPWVIGACMVFAMSMIPDMIYTVVRKPSEVTSAEGYNHAIGYLDGYTQGMNFCRNWNGDEQKLTEKKTYWNNYTKKNAQDYGIVEGALDALRHAGNQAFYEGYFKAHSWVNGKTKEQIDNQYNIFSSGIGGIPTNQIGGYCQRLSIEIKIFEQKN